MTQRRRVYGRSRPWIAMATAYALALQALLGSFGLAQAAAAGPSLPLVLCVDGGGAAPAPHMPGDASLCNHCVVCSGVQAVDLPVPQDWIAAPAVFAVSISLGSNAVDPPVSRKTPRLSQGPPHIA